MGKKKSFKTAKPSTIRNALDSSASGSTSLVWSKQKLIFISILLFGIVGTVFLPSVRNGFFFWYGDDTAYVTENSHVITGLTFENVKWAFQNTEIANWFPLTWLSHMLDCQIYGLKPWGHHLTSVLWHAVNTVLLFITLRKITGATGRSLIVALLFGLHPLRVDSVAWVAERKDVLSTFFWMLSLLMYARYVQELNAKNSKPKLFYGLTLLCFAGGLMSKAMVVTLPCVLLLLDYWPFQRWQRKSAWRLVGEKIPFFVLGAAVSVVTYVAQKKWGFVETLSAYPLNVRLENAVVSYVRYLGKIIWPVDLYSFYPHPGNWPIIIVIAAGLLLLTITIVVLVTHRRWPYLAIGWFWYLGTSVPTIGLVQLGDQAMANRFTYVPMVGVLIFAVWGIYDFTKRWRFQTGISFTVVSGFLLFFTIITLQQIGYYKDTATLWRHNFAMTGDIDVAQYALGLSLDKQGQTDEAIKELQAVLKARPNRSDVHFNLATIFQEHGRWDEAVAHYREVLKLSSGSNDARYNLGLCLLQKGLSAEAIFQFEEMIRMNRDPRAHNVLGTVYASAGNLDEAIRYFNEALKATPNDATAHNNLAIALADKGLVAEAMRHFQEALRLEPNSALARSYLDSLQKTGKPPD